jgi:hypothetical protein
VQVAATKPSLTFFRPEDIRRPGVDVWTDDDEWGVRALRFCWRVSRLVQTAPPFCSPPSSLA